jgi:hypothetical protein
VDINLSINVIILNHQYHQLATSLSASIVSSVSPTNLSVFDGGQMHPLGAVTFKMRFAVLLHLAILCVYSAVQIEQSSGE